MSQPPSTLLLDTVLWDLVVDASGNIALATTPYAQAQDVSSACRLVQGEYIFDASQGVPFSTILGQSPSLGAMKSDFEMAALSVPDVGSATCFVAGVQDRLVTMQVQAGLLSTGTVVVSPVFSTSGAPGQTVLTGGGIPLTGGGKVLTK